MKKIITTICFAFLVLWTSNSYGQKEMPKSNASSIKTEPKQLENNSNEQSVEQPKAIRLEKTPVSFQHKINVKEATVIEKENN